MLISINNLKLNLVQCMYAAIHIIYKYLLILLHYYYCCFIYINTNTTVITIIIIVAIIIAVNMNLLIPLHLILTVNCPN